MICDAPPEQIRLTSLTLNMLELEEVIADWFLFSRHANGAAVEAFECVGGAVSFPQFGQ